MVFGFFFGAFRGVLLVTLLYLGFLYLIGKEKKMPVILLESYTFQYVKTTSDLITKVFIDQLEPTIVDSEKQK